MIAAIERAGVKLIALLAEHAETAAALGRMHGDPIDRLLVGTARLEQMVLTTRDAELLERAGQVLGKLLMKP